MEREESESPGVASRILDHAMLPPQPACSPVMFTFDGEEVAGRPGEPVAAALMAHGVRVFRTMPRSGEPRGGYCLVGRCSDCLVEIDGVPGIQACVTPLVNGMIVRTQLGLGEVGEAEGLEPIR